MIRLTRRYRFCSSHRLHSPALPEQVNRDIYGKCNNPYGHGHDYVLEVSVRGEVDRETGLLLDTRVLDELVENSVIRPFHMRNLNTEVAEFQSLVPTTENLAVVARGRLAGQWLNAFPGGQPSLDGVRILETKRNIFELAGTDQV